MGRRSLPGIDWFLDDARDSIDVAQDHVSFARNDANDLRKMLDIAREQINYALDDLHVVKMRLVELLREVKNG